MYRLIKKYWFLIGLLLVFVVTVADTGETVSSIGRWLKMHRGPDAVIVLIFFLSGLILNARQIRSGVMDIKGIISDPAPNHNQLIDEFDLRCCILQDF